jgi:hypothetical protein
LTWRAPANPVTEIDRIEIANDHVRRVAVRSLLGIQSQSGLCDIARAKEPFDVGTGNADRPNQRCEAPDMRSDRFIMASGDDLSDRRLNLLAAIDSAFDGVELGTGVSLRETIAIDNSRTPTERAAIRAGDEQHNWRKLVDDPDLWRIVHVGGISFYDDDGYRFHLPAYLTLAVRDPHRTEIDGIVDSLLFKLTVHFDTHPVLSAAQRKCVHDALVFLREEYESESEELDRAIRGWSRIDDR